MSFRLQKTVYRILMLCSVISYSQQKKNIALGKPVIATSEDSKYSASNAVDGMITRESKWMTSTGKAPHILEIDLQKYCNVNEVVVHTGIPESEKTAGEATQAAGFWTAKNFKLQYWDDANWSDMPNTEIHENRVIDVHYNFTFPINTFKIRFICDDGDPINVTEIEVFGTETSNMPVAGSTVSLLKKTEKLADQDISIKVNNAVIGKSMKYVGYNAGYYKERSNVSAWVEYSNVNTLRVWPSLDLYAPLAAFEVDKALATIEEFDKRKAELRANPENNRFIKWNQLLGLYDKTNGTSLNYVLSELNKLGVDPLLEINNTDFDNTWSNKWQQWQRFYSLAFYAAKEGDVTMFSMQNEPNHRLSGPMKLEQWIDGMKIVSDALSCAIEDVNKLYNKNLKARMVGPVTAGNNSEWAAGIAKAQRTDYHGKSIDYDLLGIFSTHSYNSPAAGYRNRVKDINKILLENQPAGKPLPIVYTEIGRWMNAYLIDKEETMDSPSLFTEWAGIYTNNTKNKGYGMWAFIMSNITLAAEPYGYNRGIKSGHHFTWQGKRIVEDAYLNLALHKPVKTNSKQLATVITDGDKTNQSVWLSDKTLTEKWLEIDLGAKQELGSAVVYTGSAGGTNTAPDRVRNFSLQYNDNGVWKTIPDFTETKGRYAQVFNVFPHPVTTDKVRFISTDPGVLKVREIKLFAKDAAPVEDQANYNISGIQRTGEVVRLFAKGFKDQRAMLDTKLSFEDVNLDAITSFDSISGNYYMWLVQRDLNKYKLDIDLSSLNVTSGSPITVETVNDSYYGEVSALGSVSADKKLKLILPAQSVMLVTIPSGNLKKQTIQATNNATVSAGINAGKNFGSSKKLLVALNAAQPEKNKVSYIHFDVSKVDLDQTKCIVLALNGNASDEKVFRFHVYAIPSANFDQNQINWKNAPQLDAKEALITQVGQKAFVAGELAFDSKEKYHYLDVTSLMKKHRNKDMTFVLVRETRQLGDDEDKGREVIINSKESDKKPKLEIWTN
jgi:hypothetical protein